MFSSYLTRLLALSEAYKIQGPLQDLLLLQSFDLPLLLLINQRILDSLSLMAFLLALHEWVELW